jgi:hypothetical protein
MAPVAATHSMMRASAAAKAAAEPYALLMPLVAACAMPVVEAVAAPHCHFHRGASL